MRCMLRGAYIVKPAEFVVYPESDVVVRSCQKERAVRHVEKESAHRDAGDALAETLRR